MEIGYNHPLFILPFDHRGTFIEKMFGIHGRSPNLVESSLIRGMKQVVYDAFVESLSQGVPRENAGILVDEQFGTEILKEARGAGFHLACPVEKSGQEEFDFEYGEQFGDHLVAVRPDFAKALVRYNSASDPQLNERQLTRLRRLADFLHAHGMRLMFELIVPPLHVQLKLVDGLQGRYDAELRPSLTRKAMQEIQEAGVEPDLWKVEGMQRPEDCAALADQARSGGRSRVSLILLGRGEDSRRVREWFKAASRIEAYVGFAVGRTVFWDSLLQLKAGRLARQDAVEQISKNFRALVDLWQGLRLDRPMHGFVSINR